ncbi:peptidase M56 family protein [Paenarthrobacter sp. NPDC090520]|uniref:peptidase M56 family protein n=1 Tax=Paenarthrobacter sp. NPDC090520 TaxID=3364382 RepID=UPI003813E7F0
MNHLKAGQEFSMALRQELVARVDQATTARRRRAAHRWIGVCAFVGAGLLGGVGAAASGLITIPGAPQITPLGTPTTKTYTGTATVEFGEAPPDATAIQMKLTCLTTGSWAYESGATSSCKATDVDSRWGVTKFQIPLEPGKDSTTIATQAQSKWELTWTFVNEQSTGWATNDAGKTYGAQNDKGLPEMVLVVDTNGVRGYVNKDELEDATGQAVALTFKTREEALAWQESRKGKTFKIPVYDSDGKTVVGEFVISNGEGSVPVQPEASSNPTG